MTDTSWQQRPEAERLLERLSHMRTPTDDRGNPEADTLLLEIIARMSLNLDDRMARQEAGVVNTASIAIAVMRSAMPFLREVAARLSEPRRDAEPPDVDDDAGHTGRLAELVRGTHQVAGVTRVHYGPSGHANVVEPTEMLKARPMMLLPGDVVSNLQEYPHGYSPRLYLGHMSHPYLPDVETLLWWTDEGSAITPSVERTDGIGILLPSTDPERQIRLKRWAELMG